MEDTGWCGGETRDRELRYMNLFCMRKRFKSTLLRVVAQRFGAAAFSMIPALACVPSKRRNSPLLHRKNAPLKRR